MRLRGHRTERPFAEVPATLRLEASDGSLRSHEFSQAGLGPDGAQFKPLHHAGAVGLFMKSGALRMPQMKHLRRQKAINSAQPRMMQAKDQIGVLVTPPLIDLIESVDGKEIVSPNPEVATANSTP